MVSRSNLFPVFVLVLQFADAQTLVPSAAPSASAAPTLVHTDQNTVCQMMNITSAKQFAMRAYTARLNTTECLDVQVDHVLEDGTTYPACIGTLFGAGPDEPTVIPSYLCTAYEIQAGETVAVKISTTPSNQCGSNPTYINFAPMNTFYSENYRSCS